ncbi:hypothetical protein Asppvi_009894 [Aspergillus pseudoviridinutans]|uniref:Uncharacterized protein n=1 Tax=Aspergillus pseudoviridinutans TaxID=1517512 RepID=A0A9P3BNE4_9EURO|nr:uncharacterized protein Asppvi_009894 [Aspergillus pseudoviridinutans]GIJ90929.1 hypothetical protein Asppvi_009894 [Aspergillus pseudoviridinutans]
MRFSFLSAVALASGSIAQNCNPGADYCGWFLSNNLGWTNIPDETGLWLCNDAGESASYIEHCRFNCTGPNAHCPSSATTTTTTTTSTTSTSSSTTTTTTKYTGKPGF